MPNIPLTDHIRNLLVRPLGPTGQDLPFSQLQDQASRAQDNIEKPLFAAGTETPAFDANTIHPQDLFSFFADNQSKVPVVGAFSYGPRRGW